MGKIIQFGSKKEKYQQIKSAQSSNKQQEKPSDGQQLPDFVKCTKCGGYRYTDTYILKKVTPFQNPELERTTIMPILLYSCINCGKLVDMTQLHNG